YNLACPPAERYPIISAINGFDTITGCQKEQLEFAWEENVHIEFGQIAFMFACLKELFVCPCDMLQLLKGIILSAGIEEHRKFVVRGLDLVFQVDIRRPVEGIAQVINIRKKGIDDESTTVCEMVVSIFKGI